MKDFKIFCIGFAKTGTTSLSVALLKLGYTVTGPNWVHNPYIKDTIYTLVRKQVPLYDAFQDEPWPVLYKYLDANYRGKFILTTRPVETWIKSLLKHCQNKVTPFRKWIYGYANPKGHEAVYMARYQRHNDEVREYFKGRNDFLELNIIEGEGYEKLCPFLGHEVINEKFPHFNKIQEN